MINNNFQLIANEQQKYRQNHIVLNQLNNENLIKYTLINYQSASLEQNMKRSIHHIPTSTSKFQQSNFYIKNKSCLNKIYHQIIWSKTSWKQKNFIIKLYLLSI
jgi:hypothetical protein